MANRPYRQQIDFGSQEAIDRIENLRSSREWKALSFSQKVRILLDECIEREPKPAVASPPATLAELIAQNWGAILAERVSQERLEQISQGDQPCDLEVARISLACGLSVAQIEEMIASQPASQPARGKKNAAKK